jgi:hypothetical protein
VGLSTMTTEFNSKYTCRKVKITLPCSTLSSKLVCSMFLLTINFWQVMAVHALEFHVSVHESNTSVPYQFLASSDMFRTLVNMLRLFYINFGETNHI